MRRIKSKDFFNICQGSWIEWDTPNKTVGVVGALEKQTILRLSPLTVSIQCSVFGSTIAHMAS